MMLFGEREDDFPEIDLLDNQSFIELRFLILNTLSDFNLHQL